MKLTLRIENYDFLPDGGPLEFSVTARGCEVGRDPAMDWTLPDPTRHISSRHFEVIFRDRQFWLTDISTNGTFVYGAQMRVSSPLHLVNNDRLQVGQYIIRVTVADGVAAFAPAQPFAATPPPPTDPWSLTPAPAPMPSPGAAPPRPMMSSPMPAPAPTPAPMPAPPTAPPVNAPFMGGAATSPNPQGEPFVLKSPPAPVPAPTPAPLVQAATPAAGSEAGMAANAALLDAICRGAGLPAGTLNSLESAQLGEDIGRCLRIATEELMALLGARAAAKQFVKSASRTMIGGVNNSPLKFKPSAEEAMLTMFGKPTGSYLSSTASFQQGFDDIKRHQTAVYAAMQPALARLLEDLSPESIEGRATGGLMTSKKSRAWETFVERWDAKTHPYENGMLDVFLAYFADAYDVAVKKTGG